jgi:hypothetical protein
MSSNTASIAGGTLARRASEPNASDSQNLTGGITAGKSPFSPAKRPRSPVVRSFGRPYYVHLPVQSDKRKVTPNLILDNINGIAIIWVCQVGWSRFRFPRLKHPSLTVAFHPLSPLLATLPRNRSDLRHYRTPPKLISIPPTASLSPLLSYRLPTPTS